MSTMPHTNRGLSPSPESMTRTRPPKSSSPTEETEVSSLVKDAVRQARKSSSRIRNGSPQKQHPHTPTGLVIKTSEATFSPDYMNLNSPSLSEMDQLLAPTYESGSFRGSSVGGASINSSDDIIRKVEMEIASARRAATEAHARLANALSHANRVKKQEDEHDDPLEDLDLRDILSLSVEDSLEGLKTKPSADAAKIPTVDEHKSLVVPENVSDDMPEDEKRADNGAEQQQQQQQVVMDEKQADDGVELHHPVVLDENQADDGVELQQPVVLDENQAGDGVELKHPVINKDEVFKDSSDDADGTTQTETGESSASKGTTESDEQLPPTADDEHLPTSREHQLPNSPHTQHTFESAVEFPLVESEMTRDGTFTSTDMTRSEEAPGDDDSEYTEETVSDDEDDNSEYTEETVNSDEEEQDQDGEAPKSSWWALLGQHPGLSEEGATSADYDTPFVTSGEFSEAPGVTSGEFSEVDGTTSADYSETMNGATSGDFTEPRAIPSGDLTAASSSLHENVETTMSFVNRIEGESVDQREGTDLENEDPSHEGKAQVVLEGGGSEETPIAEGGTSKSLAPEDDLVDVNEPTTAEEADGVAATPSDEGCDGELNDTDESALRELTVITGNTDPETEVDAPESGRKGARVQFRYPYPVPPQLPKPRPSSEIIAEYTLGDPERVAKWSKPKPELEELLLAVKGDSMQRRSNACGALKVLLSRNAKNVFFLVRTVGFLEALVFAINEDIVSSPDMEMALITRTRAVTTIMKVSEPKENRILVMLEPGMPECLTKVIQEDTGEARAHACVALAMLAKTAANREAMVKVPELITSLARVVNGTIDPTVGPRTQLHTKTEPTETYNGFGSSSFSSGEDHDDGMSAGASSIGSATHPSVVDQLPSSDSIRKQKDDKKEEFVLQAKVNACAVLMHMSKHCSISFKLSNNDTLMDSMVNVSRNFDSPLHTRCLEILCNLTRFPANNAEMARDDVVVDTFVKCGKSRIVEDRVWALRSLQNMAADSASKVILANSRILTLLSISAMRKDDEQEAAVAALYNLSTEPGAVVPLTNTKNVIATLVHLAHNALSPPPVRKMSCEALATIGLWLQTLAGSGTIPEEMPKVLLPTHKTTGWERWD